VVQTKIEKDAKRVTRWEKDLSQKGGKGRKGESKWPPPGDKGAHQKKAATKIFTNERVKRGKKEMREK